MGYFKGLQELGLLDKIRYVVGVSGGSWGSAPFCYLPADYDDDLFLGPKTMPEKLSEELLQASPKGSMTWAIAHADIAADTLLDWSYAEAVGDIFLKPFGIAPTGKFFSSDAKAVANILARNKGLKPKDFITLREGRPYLIMGGTMMAQKFAKGADNYPFDLTPLYVGTSPHHPEEKVGGIFVEPFGFDTDRPRSLADGTAVTAYPKTRLPLSGAIGVSGEVLAETVKEYNIDVLFPRYKYWNAASAGDPGPAPKYDYGDGGVVDNPGILSLLARKVENIAVFLTEPIDVDVPSQSKAEEFNRNYGYNQIAALFGQPFKGDGKLNMHTKVFDESGFQPLYEGARKAKDEGGPVMFQSRYEVLKNDWFNVDGGWDCEILWMFIDTTSSWEAQLPVEIREQIGTSGQLCNFPLINVIAQNPPHVILLHPKQTNMLGNLAYWLVKSQATVLTSLLGDPQQGAIDE